MVGVVTFHLGENLLIVIRWPGRESPDRALVDATEQAASRVRSALGFALALPFGQ
jgi:hypothetical protein